MPEQIWPKVGGVSSCPTLWIANMPTRQPNGAGGGFFRRRTRDRSCEPLHRSRINLKSQYPPAWLGLTWQHLDWIIASILSSIRRAQLVIKQCYGCCRLMLKNTILDGPLRHHLASDTILAGFPYILLQQGRYRRNWRSTSRETNMSRKQTASLSR